ncbi:helix-turn-helix domain-containing protein, partial [Enterococcus faecium]|uniref:helix-turn-helix domain-containing protein n=1 Tax=Enterococcus faecium TaxID=1352 RepID=UPI0032B5CBF2
MNQKTSKVEKEFYLRCSYLTLSVLFDKEPKSFGCVRKVYNLMLDDRKKAYEEVKNDSSKKMTFPTPAKYK